MASTSTNNLFILVAVMAALSSVSMAEARVLSNPNAFSLRARLKLEGESSSCWDSLFKLQACSGEIIMFFINGETHLGPSCCQVIRIIGHECWPNIYSALGFSAEEGDVLQGYCDDEDVHSPPSLSSLEPKKLVP